MRSLTRLADDAAIRLRAATRSVAAAVRPDLIGRSLLGPDLELLAAHPHDATAWTQGLAWSDGALFESTGLEGRSTVREVELETGRIRRLRRLPHHHFGEGLAVVGERLVQLTWRSGRALLWDRSTLEPLGEIALPGKGEGWGLAFDGRDLLMSDGSARLRRLDATSLAQIAEFEVLDEGRPVEGLNDLAVVGDEILAVQHARDRIARIASSGAVLGWVDVSPLRHLHGMRGREQVTNGIAWDAARARLFLTGKRWPRLFELAWPPPPAPPSEQAETPRARWRGTTSSRADGSALTLSTHASIGEIARDEWDALVGDDVPSSHGWLTTVERTVRTAHRPVYVLVRRGSCLVGAAACYETLRARPCESLDARLFGRLRSLASALGLSFLPALVCGPPGGAGGHPLVSPAAGEDDRRRVLERLVSGIEAEAARCGRPVCFVDVAARRRDLVTILEARGYLVSVDLPFNVLDVTWDSFDGYLRHLDGVTRGARKDVRRQVNQNRNRGTEIVTIEEPGQADRRLHALMEGNERAHNRRSFAFAEGFFSALKRDLGRDAVVYAAVKHNRICGVSLLLRRGEAGFLPMVGVDHAATGRDFTFFNLAHYRPIADAIAGGLRRLHLGRALYGLKARRGCRLEPAVVFFRPRRRRSRAAVRAWFALLSAWNTAQVGAIGRWAAARHSP